jgi:hypothetical protein
MDIYLYGTNRCSIAGISTDYSGAIRLSQIVNCLLENSASVFTLVQRPSYGEVALSRASIANISDKIDNLKLADNSFSISFYYTVHNKNDGFVNAFIQMWREYEQPGFFFFSSDLKPACFNIILEDRTLPVGEKDRLIFDLAPCYMTFKSIEDDVLWIDKHDQLSFDPVLLFSDAGKGGSHHRL